MRLSRAEVEEAVRRWLDRKLPREWVLGIQYELLSKYLVASRCVWCGFVDLNTRELGRVVCPNCGRVGTHVVLGGGADAYVKGRLEALRGVADAVVPIITDAVVTLALNDCASEVKVGDSLLIDGGARRVVLRQWGRGGFVLDLGSECSMQVVMAVLRTLGFVDERGYVAVRVLATVPYRDDLLRLGFKPKDRWLWIRG